MADQAAKQRVITHMNNDHHDSVVRYLEHYNKQSAWSASSGQITDITLSELTIKSDAGVYKYTFSPPMDSLRDARERLVAMDKECVTALGRSDITVREWPLFKGKEWFFALFWSVALTMYFKEGALADGGMYGFLPAGFRQFTYRNRNFTMGLILTAHVFETIYMTTSRLKKYNVNPRSSVYWKWVAETFLNGFAAFQRFDRQVHRQQKAREGLKH